MTVRIFGHYVPAALLALGAIGVGVLLGAFYLSVFLRWAETDDLAGELVRFLPEAGLYVAVTLLSMVALGLHQRETIGDVRTTLVRLLATMALAFVALAVIFYVYPPVIIWRGAVAIAMPLSVVGILAVRRAFLWCVSLKSFRRRILILGAGTRAAQIATYEESGRHHHGFAAVGYLRLQDNENEVDSSRPLDELGSLLDYVREHQVEEIVIAAQERRGSLPVRALLECRLYGIRVTDIGGWAQLNYPYGASVEDARRKLEYDLYYVKNCNVFLDLLILVQTLRMVIRPHGVR